MSDEKKAEREEPINGFKITVTAPALSSAEYTEIEQRVARVIIACLSDENHDEHLS